jgi:hypothetical protein
MARLALCADCGEAFTPNGLCDACIRRHHDQREMHFVIAASEAERIARKQLQRQARRDADPETFERQRQQNAERYRQTRGSGSGGWRGQDYQVSAKDTRRGPYNGR